MSTWISLGSLNSNEVLKISWRPWTPLDEAILTLTPEEGIEEEIVQADEVRELIKFYTAPLRLELALKPVPVAIIHAKKPSDPSIAV